MDIPESVVGSGAGFDGFATAFLTAGRKIGCLAFAGGDCKFNAFAGGGGVVVLSAAAGGCGGVGSVLGSFCGSTRAGGSNSHHESVLAVTPFAIAPTEPRILGTAPLPGVFFAAIVFGCSALALGLGGSAAFGGTSLWLMLGFAATSELGALAPSLVAFATSVDALATSVVAFATSVEAFATSVDAFATLLDGTTVSGLACGCTGADAVDVGPEDGMDGPGSLGSLTTGKVDAGAFGPGTAAGGSSTVAAALSVGLIGSMFSKFMSSVTLSTSLYWIAPAARRSPG